MRRFALIISMIFCSVVAYAADYTNVIVPRPLSCKASEGEFVLSTKTIVRVQNENLVNAGKIFA